MPIGVQKSFLYRGVYISIHAKGIYIVNAPNGPKCQQYQSFSPTAFNHFFIKRAHTNAKGGVCIATQSFSKLKHNITKTKTLEKR